jgi:hypothetical protein
MFATENYMRVFAHKFFWPSRLGILAKLCGRGCGGDSPGFALAWHPRCLPMQPDPPLDEIQAKPGGRGVAVSTIRPDQPLKIGLCGVLSGWISAQAETEPTASSNRTVANAVRRLLDMIPLPFHANGRSLGLDGEVVSGTTKSTAAGACEPFGNAS